MSKLQYVLRQAGDRPLSELRARVLDELGPSLLAAGPAGLKVSLTEPGLPRPFHLPMQRGGLALVSIWPTAEAVDWTRLIGSIGLPADGYRVTESVPLRYRPTSADGERSPGVAMLTMFRRRPGIGRAQFLSRWHQGHSPMALRIHPLVGYVRNVVEERITDGAALCDGIVEEHFGSARDLTDPRRFYGGTWRLLPRMLHVLAQTHTFLHLPTIENFLLGEHWLRSPV